MKRKVMRTGTGSLREVIAIAVQNLDEEAQAFLKTIPGLSRNIHNWRQKILGIPGPPACRLRFQIPDVVKYFEKWVLGFGL